MKKIRVFLAVPIPARLRSNLVSVIDELSPSVAGVHWTDPKGMHITLKFFGEIGELEVVEIARSAQRVAITHAPFEVTVKGLGAFPAHDRPRTLWAGIREGAEQVIQLQSDLAEAFVQLGYQAETRRFHPHLTIGRVRDKSGIAELATELESRRDRPLGEATIEKVVVYSSEFSRDGMIYAKLATCPLGNAVQQS